MNRLKDRLTNLLTLNRNVFSRLATAADDHSTPNARINAEDKTLTSPQSINDSDSPLDWFQATHGKDHYND